MYKHSTLSHIICVIVLNLEVVDCNRCFENLVLNLFHNDVFTVYKNEDVPGSQVNRICPTLYGRVEGMGRCCDDFFTVYEDMDKLVGFVYISFYNFFKGNITGLFIPCPYLVAC